MTFSKILKEELVTIPVDEFEMLAEFLAFLHLSSSIEVNQENKKIIIFKTKQPMVAIRFLKLLNSLYPAKGKLSYVEETKLLKKKNIEITIEDEVEKIISEHGLFEKFSDEKELLTNTPETKKAYLRAAFLTRGSINSPKTSEYHLEIFSQNQEEVIFMQRLLTYFNLNSKISKRRNGFIVYMKEAEKISDFIKLVGAQNNLFLYEDYRIKRDMQNSINRVINCEIYNSRKTFSTAEKQLKQIQYLEEYNPSVFQEQDILEIATLRKEFPDASLEELSFQFREKYQKPITKSGIYHRFNKIKKLVPKGKI